MDCIPDWFGVRLQDHGPPNEVIAKLEIIRSWGGVPQAAGFRVHGVVDIGGRGEHFFGAGVAGGVDRDLHEFEYPLNQACRLLITLVRS